MSDHADTIREFLSMPSWRSDGAVDPATALAALDALLAERQQAIDALRVYADPRHWAISRDDLNHRVVSWIGPGADKAGMPDALETARAALLNLGETE